MKPTSPFGRGAMVFSAVLPATLGLGWNVCAIQRTGNALIGAGSHPIIITN